jgi:thiol-disulfide isomerase/thioredoxin
MNPVSLLFLSCAALGAAPETLVLNFTSPHCPPCQQAAPVVARLYRQGYEFRKVDVTQHPEIARKFGVTNLPTFLLLVDGREADRIVGYKGEEHLTAFAQQARNQKAADAASFLPTDAPAAVPLPRSAPRESQSTAVADNEPAKPRFQFPFLKSKTESAEQDASEQPNVVRAKLDGVDRRGTTPVSFEQKDAPADPFAASTRIRVKDDNGASFGSGTIIESRPGRSLVLTCGHIFRDLGRNARIEVDVFDGEQIKTYVGKVVHYIEDPADVGLISIATADPLPAVSVATAGYRVRRGDPVLNVGCSGGDPPTKQELNVTALNRYLGPDNIECTGVPVQGRSGGGLFSGAGQVIGVCVAADPRDRRGLYAGLGTIYELLDQCGLERLYQPSGTVPSRQPQRPFGDDWEIVSNEDGGQPLGGHSRADHAAEPATASERLADVIPAEFTGGSRFGASELRPGDIAGIGRALEGAGEAEVVCIVRSLDDPQAASKVVIINRASSKFVSYLTDELDPQSQPITTALKVSDTPADDAQAAQFARKSRAALQVGGIATSPARPTGRTNDSVQHSAGAGQSQSARQHISAEPQRYRRSSRSK